MKTKVSILVVYALLLFIGGLIGYVKAQSIASLLMGSIFAFLILFSAFLMQKRVAAGLMLARVLTLFLSLFFLYRLFQTQKLMPSGMMAFFSLIVVILLFRIKKIK